MAPDAVFGGSSGRSFLMLSRAFPWYSEYTLFGAIAQPGRAADS